MVKHFIVSALTIVHALCVTSQAHKSIKVLSACASHHDSVQNAHELHLLTNARA
jgi:hypothetical protein